MSVGNGDQHQVKQEDAILTDTDERFRPTLKDSIMLSVRKGNAKEELSVHRMKGVGALRM